jgi:hypothetical protein
MLSYRCYESCYFFDMYRFGCILVDVGGGSEVFPWPWSMQFGDGYYSSTVTSSASLVTWLATSWMTRIRFPTGGRIFLIVTAFRRARQPAQLYIQRDKKGRYLCTRRHGATSRYTAIFILMAVRTSDLTGKESVSPQRKPLTTINSMDMWMFTSSTLHAFVRWCLGTGLDIYLPFTRKCSSIMKYI